MTELVTVSAGDIARLGGVGRAAVSNWRRRHADFPQPVAGSPASPRYDVVAVESWLRRNGKTDEIPALERVWLQLCAEGGELGLGHVIGRTGALLVWLRDGDDEPLLAGVAERADARLVELLDEVVQLHGGAQAFELLHGRLAESHARQLAVTAPYVATLMLDLAGDAATLLDPACGTGSLLLASTAPRVLGQEVAPDRALIAAARLRLHGRNADVLAGDSLRANALSGALADAVVCDPPLGDRDWGRRQLLADGRWEYGVPPRTEPELAWVQHCLALARPGGQVVVRMPPTAATRPSGQDVRAALVRRGALRAVVAAGSDSDVWLLRRPVAGEEPPTHVVLSEGRPAATVRADVEAGRGRRVADLLDDVDLRPRRRVRAGRLLEDGGRAAALRNAGLDPPALRHRAGTASPATVRIGDLERQGHVAVLHAGAQPGDVLAAGPASRVLDGPARPEAGRTVYRCDVTAVDPELLAGVLRTVGTSRAEQRRATFPRLPIEQQRAYGRTLRALADLRERAHTLAAEADAFAEGAAAGLLAGVLRPA